MTKKERYGNATEVGPVDQVLMDGAEISEIRAWLDARNNGKPYRMADYSIEATLQRLRWLLEYAERVGRPKRRECTPNPQEQKDTGTPPGHYKAEMERLWKVEIRYRALQRKLARSSQWVWSQDSGRRCG